MRTIYTSVLFLVALGAYGQGCLFEKVISDEYISRAYKILPQDSEWLVLGSMEDCSGAYIVKLDCDGNKVWSAIPSSWSEYIDGIDIGGTIYLAGYYGTDNEFGPQHGIIDAVDSNGAYINLVVDTAYRFGFKQVVSLDTLLIVSAFQIHNYPYPDSNFIVGYSTNGIKQFEWHQSHSIKTIATNAQSVFVATDSSVFKYSANGAIQVISLVYPSFSQMKIWNDTIYAVSKNSLYIMDTSFNSIDTAELSFHFDTIHSISMASDGILIAGPKNDEYQVVYLNKDLSLRNSYPVTGCFENIAIASKDSIFAVAGTEAIKRSRNIFCKTFAYDGANVSESHNLEVTSAAIDTYVWAYHVVAPGDTIFERHLTGYSVTVKNFGTSTIANFTLNTNAYGPIFCAYQEIDTTLNNLNLSPGDSLNISRTGLDRLTLPSTFFFTAINNHLTTICNYEYSIVGLNEAFTGDMDFQIYPNPANDLLMVEGQNISNLQIHLYSLTGQLLLSQPIQNKSTIDISQIPPGFYIYEVSDKGQRVKTGKLVIAR